MEFKYQRRHLQLWVYTDINGYKGTNKGKWKCQIIIHNKIRDIKINFKKKNKKPIDRGVYIIVILKNLPPPLIFMLKFFRLAFYLDVFGDIQGLNTKQGKKEPILSLLFTHDSLFLPFFSFSPFLLPNLCVI